MYNIFDHMDERTLERMQPEDYDRLVKLQGTAAELLEALGDAQAHLEYCGYGDSYERECAKDEGLPEKIDEAIRKAKGN